MKRIALIALASIALFATDASAHQSNNWGNNHMRTQQAGYSYANCPMGGNMIRGNQGMMHNYHGMMNSTQTPSAQSPDTNWRANPSYQGQTGSNGANSN